MQEFKRSNENRESAEQITKLIWFKHRRPWIIIASTSTRTPDPDPVVQFDFPALSYQWYFQLFYIYAIFSSFLSMVFVVIWYQWLYQFFHVYGIFSSCISMVFVKVIHSDNLLMHAFNFQPILVHFHFYPSEYLILNVSFQILTHLSNNNFLAEFRYQLIPYNCHCGLVVSAPAWDGTGCEFDSWQCRIYIPCSLSLRLLGSLRGSLGTYGLTQKLC